MPNKSTVLDVPFCVTLDVTYELPPPLYFPTTFALV